ncbi:MAG: helix-turn-helix transcriptional regulator [Christensenellaceae bacterium]|nr:helix-turn-helix transcriptional regulator [Christensenellaceae bacterium]
MSIVERIRELCDHKSISFNALEKTVGLGKSVIYRWDINSPSADKLKLVADYFGVTVDYLLTGEQKEKPDYIAELSKSQRVLVDRVMAMSEDQAAAFLQMLDAFQATR